jgi:uncharacterized protein YbaP (TraB family)
MTALDLGMRKIGFQPERGVEQYVLGRARAANKEIVGLETLAFQIGLFDALPREQQQAMLEQTLAEIDEGAAVLGEMVAAWRAGELDSLSAELDGRRYLVVVGALHLVGPDSVIELLQQRGHDVERLQ